MGWKSQTFKPGDAKTPRLKNLGISIRIATINANVNLTNEAQIEGAKGILTMQKDYSQKKHRESPFRRKVDQIIQTKHQRKAKMDSLHQSDQQTDLQKFD